MRTERIIIYLVLLLVIFGLIMIGSSSVVDATRDFSDKWYYFKLQSLWAIIGFIGLLVARKFPVHKLEKLSLPLLGISMLLLVLVLIPGIGIKILGARRWINLGFTSFQPSEIVKLTLAIYFSSLLKHTDRFLQFCFILAAVSGLVILQPDIGTAIIIILSAFTIYSASQNSLRKLLILFPLGIVLATALIFVAPYRLARLRTFMDQSHDPLGSSYQIRQALLGLGSGGITGLGLGQSRQKYQFLPEVTTDSIFAVIGEELGLIGTAGLVLAFLALSLTGFEIARKASSPFFRLLAIGVTSVVSSQALINISANIALLPYTGIPLPFISYGGTSLVILMVGMGIVANIAASSSHG
ncbi:MAG: Stage V sporulation protein E [Candidatus Amesbacteria bacterium GW2011_GWB1_47_19]|nr:MAG: Stage V sporulation protein E [Candidatus Amesbacteria bacterium GW2011_GWA1_44_24]KKU30945.1 MAG: Stage V sporulation protein E [Candidatus Amesbacteria bacterium GW2011_GWC1_46_24]KKU66608.1 MAG: Stage V sporulation protein E [Candidatus Amesbacteria bacterium GW2011_GWB1_47_19]OGD05328.1 MAG: cell division protein FtsW [Candidatus Amesbacteria bacterium RIFOXYB1_FULL_47_13]HBC73217.1 putative lipid II flippase FtsW [Candidatus Amesbacteria bacterium]